MLKNGIKDPVSALTHFIGLLACIPCIFDLIFQASHQDAMTQVIGFAIFGLSLVLLYGASTIYHTLYVSEAKTILLRRIDHIMIFVLIAGTYTPICLVSLAGPWGWTMLALIWILAIGGAVMKIFWIQAPRWLSTSIYYHGMVGSHCFRSIAESSFLGWGGAASGRRSGLYSWRYYIWIEKTESAIGWFWIP